MQAFASHLSSDWGTYAQALRAVVGLSLVQDHVGVVPGLLCKCANLCCEVLNFVPGLSQKRLKHQVCTMYLHRVCADSASTCIDLVDIPPEPLAPSGARLLEPQPSKLHFARSEWPLASLSLSAKTNCLPVLLFVFHFLCFQKKHFHLNPHVARHHALDTGPCRFRGL